MPHFRRKSVIEARQVPVYAAGDVAEYVEGCFTLAVWCNGDWRGAKDGHITIPVRTSTGQWPVEALPGDWIIKDGETYRVMVDRLFTELYEPVDPLPGPIGPTGVSGPLLAEAGG